MAMRRFTVQLLSKKFELAYNLWSVVRLFTKVSLFLYYVV